MRFEDRLNCALLGQDSGKISFTITSPRGESLTLHLTRRGLLDLIDRLEKWSLRMSSA